MACTSSSYNPYDATILPGGKVGDWMCNRHQMTRFVNVGYCGCIGGIRKLDGGRHGRILGRESSFVYGAYYFRKGRGDGPKKVVAVRDWSVPMNQRQKHEFKWGELENKGFEDLKARISCAPILGLPNFNEMFVVEADASDVRIGAVLMQRGQPISYFSLKLGSRMRVAATYQKELFAIVESIYKWRQYLVGLRFTKRTDHRFLKELMQQVIQRPLQKKYVRKLMGFDFVIEYKPGVTNRVVGALSRMFKEEKDVVDRFMTLSQPLPRLISEIRQENETLDELQQIHQKLDRNELMEGVRREQGMIVFRDHYYIVSESKLKELLLSEFHNPPTAGHSGVKKILLQPLSMPSSVWEDILMDFITGVPVYKGLSVIFVVVDQFTKYAHFGPLPASFNAPKYGLSPQTDGQTKDVNCGLGQYLRAMVSDRPQHWVRVLQWAKYSYNTSFHSSIKMSHYQVVYGRVPPTIVPYLLGSSKVTAVENSLVERDALLRQLKQNLLVDKHRMEMQANRNLRDVEFKSEFKTTYPSYHLEDKVIFEGGGNDTPVPKED
nr:hypothetical protein [Tanacetum cinerariifolium]